jgi:hypothetical protein
VSGTDNRPERGSGTGPDGASALAVFMTGKRLLFDRRRRSLAARAPRNRRACNRPALIDLIPLRF